MVLNLGAGYSDKEFNECLFIHKSKKRQQPEDFILL
jgi:hypothetical protein